MNYNKDKSEKRRIRWVSRLNPKKIQRKGAFAAVSATDVKTLPRDQMGVPCLVFFGLGGEIIDNT